MVKWGVLGTANIAKGCTIPGMKGAENCELYAIAGRKEDKVRRYKDDFGFAVSYIGYDKLLEDPEVQAVYIPLPNHLHKEWVMKALRAGKHVLCEKPLALHAEDAREMFAEAAANHVILMEAYVYLHSPYVPSLQSDIRSGIIGEVDYLDTAFLTPGYTEDIRLYREMGGGALYDLGCYCTTMILSLVDAEPDHVTGAADFNEYGADRYTSAMIQFKNGVYAAFNAGMIFTPGVSARKDRLYIHGSRGCINSNVEYNQSGILTYTVTADGETIERSVTAGQNYTLEVEQLGRCIENGEKQHITPDFSIRNAEVMDMILRGIGYYTRERI